MRPHLTGNEKAANGPLPGDYSRVEAEPRGGARVASPGLLPLAGRSRDLRLGVRRFGKKGEGSCPKLVL